MMINYFLLMIIGVLLSSISQILLKKGALKNIQEKSFIKQYLDKNVIGGYLLLFIAMFMPLIAYSVIPLKYGAVIESLAYVFVMILSAIFLKERITKKKLIGNLMIVGGVIFFGMSIF
jgi:drug/metabolite transporter (DMT)-like permease